MSELERVQYKMMLPVQLKAALEEAAHDNRRSLSAEIIARLYHSLEIDEAEGWAPSDPITTPDEMYAMMQKIIDRTIRTVREEERKAGLSPLPNDRPGTKPSATAQPDALIRNPDGTYTVVEVKVAEEETDFDPDLPKPTHGGGGGFGGKMKP